MNLVPIASLTDVPPDASVRCTAAGRDVALFRIGDSYYAIDNTCPHRAGSLADGTISEHTVTCPLHGWQFDVRSGRCVSGALTRLRTYPVELRSDRILVDLDAPAPAPDEQQFLIRFGAMGHIGRFRSAGLTPARGTRVVVRSSRGVEIGEVLLCAASGAPLVADQPESGELLRAMNEADRERERTLRDGQQQAFEACQQLLAARGVAVQLVDAERLFDGATLIFYFLGDAPPALADITNELARQYESHVQFRPFGAEAGLAAGCGSGDHECGDCGDGSRGEGSCGSGACRHETPD